MLPSLSNRRSRDWKRSMSIACETRYENTGRRFRCGAARRGAARSGGRNKNGQEEREKGSGGGGGAGIYEGRRKIEAGQVFPITSSDENLCRCLILSTARDTWSSEIAPFPTKAARGFGPAAPSPAPGFQLGITRVTGSSPGFSVSLLRPVPRVAPRHS